ncbi:unnamed protein product [Blepharisma stoltei]|uniref:Uncharacterized protein n=1 Tax=Blepharisma stoltei TaxID=1481888 RepID=A0AAU9IP67_9CILI|nr:unnamed protein product [Blepharisma stoltei]
MKEMNNNVKKHPRNDLLWETIRTSSKTISDMDFRLLLISSYIEDLETIDERIEGLVSLTNVFTASCFDYLAEIYPDKCRILIREDTIELLIFPSLNLFVYLILDRLTLQLTIKWVKKTNEPNNDESKFITDLVNRILHWLWIHMTRNN